MFNTVLVGRRIAELRKGKDMTQMELADMMGVSYQAVSNWERGNSMPDISKLGDLAAALDVSIDDLIGNEPSVNLAKHILAGDEKNYIRDEKVELNDLAEIAPLLKPTQTNNIFDAISNKRVVPVTLSELVPLAPFMGSTFLDHFIQNVDLHNFSELAEIAPFISRKVLDDLALKTQSNGKISDLAEIAPFLSREVLDDLARKTQTDGKLSELTDIAPFVSRNVLDDLARQAQANDCLNTIYELAPFISGEVLAEIAQDELKKVSIQDLSQLAPFLPKQILQKIAEKIIRETGIASIGPIAPFL